MSESPMEPPPTAPPQTGDEQVDSALADLAAHRGEDLAVRVETATDVHRRLQQRLTNPEAGSQPGD